jgi:post-segregation antitoxin (ccd killing protein)
MSRLNVYIDDELAERLREYCFTEEHMSISMVVEQIIRNHLSNPTQLREQVIAQLPETGRLMMRRSNL